MARWGDALRQLVGQEIVAVRVPARWSQRAANLVGTRLHSVLTHGKHLVLTFSTGWVIHAHAMQYGSWQIGPARQVPRKENRYVRLRLATRTHEALFFHGPVMEVLSAEEFQRHERFTTLGPDLLRNGFTYTDVLPRLRGQGDRSIGDVLLDQRVVAGIGNIYKSEGLFLAEIHPERAAASVLPSEWQTLFEQLVPLMQEGRLVHGQTTTLPPELRFEAWMRNWVYRRRGQPCFVCASPISMIRQGEFQRATYFCGVCQPRVAAGPDATLGPTHSHGPRSPNLLLKK